MTELVERDWARTHDPRCGLCGFDHHDFRDRDLPSAIRAMGDRWVVFIDACVGERKGTVKLAARPRGGGWTPLELACHERDALALAAARAEVTLLGEHPYFSAWDYEAAKVVNAYDEQDPHGVGTDIGVNATRLADVLCRADRNSWSRSGTMQGREFSVAALARFSLHEGHHHLIEAERAIYAVSVR